MTKDKIEKLPEVIQASNVLQQLELKGLIQPVIASGWIRGFTTDIQPTDIDISYVGDVHYEQAQQILRQVLKEMNIDNKNWDIDGIWNAQMAYGVTSADENLRKYYVCSIDSIYLGSDGQLHDPTKYGFIDAKTKTLRLNNAGEKSYQLIPKEAVNECLEGCRRIAKFGWVPTTESITEIQQGVNLWDNLKPKDKAYFYKKLAKKFTPDERSSVKEIYRQYGWGWIFD